MPGRHTTRTVPPALRRLGAVALTTSALAGMVGGSLADLNPSPADAGTAFEGVDGSATGTGESDRDQA